MSAAQPKSEHVGSGGGMPQAKAAAPLRSSSLQGLGPNDLPGPGAEEEGSYCL